VIVELENATDACPRHLVQRAPRIRRRGPSLHHGPGEIVASLGMPISARNQLEGKVASVKLGDIMAHVVVKIGKSHIESVITRRSAEDLKLKKGDKVTVIIKSTEVMLQKA
jgi:molybdopterin-binding protein